MVHLLSRRGPFKGCWCETNFLGAASSLKVAHLPGPATTTTTAAVEATFTTRLADFEKKAPICLAAREGQLSLGPQATTGLYLAFTWPLCLAYGRPLVARTDRLSGRANNLTVVVFVGLRCRSKVITSNLPTMPPVAVVFFRKINLVAGVVLVDVVISDSVEQTTTEANLSCCAQTAPVIITI